MLDFGFRYTRRPRLCGGSASRSHMSSGASFWASLLSGFSTARTSRTGARADSPPPLAPAAAFSSMSTLSPESTSRLISCPASGCSCCRRMVSAAASMRRWERSSALAPPSTLASCMAATVSPKASRAELSILAKSSGYTDAPGGTAYTLALLTSAISPGPMPSAAQMRACSTSEASLASTGAPTASSIWLLARASAPAGGFTRKPRRDDELPRFA
mmetsp:Transcript_10847/g.44954  ORF Transcript_10847/g.44954 Transcript_10847/m.44954 type:complete len:216 (+) Transcript_10847:3119-3766(+)